MMPSSIVSPTEYSLLDYVAIVRKRWLWVLLPVVVLVAASAAWTLTRPPRYEAEARVLLADTAAQATLDPSSQNTGFLSRELSNEISLARSDRVEALIQAELGALPSISIAAQTDADVLVFRSSAATAQAAARNANTWAGQYIQVKRDEAVADINSATVSLQVRLAELREERQRLREPLDVLDDRISRTADPETAADLQRQYDRLADDLRYELELVTGQAEAAVASLTDLELESEFAAVGEARLVQVAAPPLSTSNPPLSRNLALGTTLGLLVGFALALLAENRDNTVKTAADVAAFTDLPVLASIPEADRRRLPMLATSTHQDPEGAFANGYQKVRSSLDFASLEGELRTVLITSAGAAEGKSTSSSNLALAFASVGRKTVLVDVDFRRARIHEIYGIPRTPGVSDVVLHGADMTSVAYSVNEPGLESLLIVPSGTPPPNPGAFVGTAGFVGAMDWIREEAEMVILDAPPLLAVSDPHTMAKHVDGVVLTARAGQTTKGELVEVLTALGQVGANVLGIILIGVDESEAYGRYYYSYRSDSGRALAPPPAVGSNLWTRREATRSVDLDLRTPPEPEQEQILIR
ncbi:MAG: polysaccharide biosynthesis tyrosine autokinase [Actinomycetota bacterium]